MNVHDKTDEQIKNLVETRMYIVINQLFWIWPSEHDISNSISFASK